MAIACSRTALLAGFRARSSYVCFPSADCLAFVPVYRQRLFFNYVCNLVVVAMHNSTGSPWMISALHMPGSVPKVLGFAINYDDAWHVVATPQF